ncbi:MAG: substrate-binding domain-containing protein, partial [Pseudomonadota bacterium]
CPQDISLCGFDHFDPPQGLPKLTSIDAPFEEMGKLAVTRLHHRIRQTVSITYHTMIECRLREGESTAAIAG